MREDEAAARRLKERAELELSVNTVRFCSRCTLLFVRAHIEECAGAGVSSMRLRVRVENGTFETTSLSQVPSLPIQTA